MTSRDRCEAMTGAREPHLPTRWPSCGQDVPSISEPLQMRYPYGLTGIVSIKASELQPYECTALLFAYLAFPGVDEDDERMLAHAALCKHLLCCSDTGHEDLDWTLSPQPIKPVYLGFDIAGGTSGRDPLLTFNRRMRDRSAAVAIAKPFFQLAVHGPRLRPRGSKPLTLTGRAKLIMPLIQGNGATGGEDKNILSRIWVPSLPVLHLATAVVDLLEQMNHEGLRANRKTIQHFPVLAFLLAPEVASYLVNEAQIFENVIASVADGPLLRAGKSLIRFRLT